MTAPICGRRLARQVKCKVETAVGVQRFDKRACADYIQGEPWVGRKRGTMQRVRIGLTGLAVVFLLVLLGAVIRSFSSDEPAAVNFRSGAAGATANGQE